jgi:nicotinamide/nicotinate riboside kinase
LLYLTQVLTEIKQSGGKIPASFESKEETNTLGPSNVTDEELAEVQRSIAVDVDTLFVIVDGIMLFNEGSPLISTSSVTADGARPLDLALFVRAPYVDLLKRREARAGYVTLEGFWTDPPGYFDDIVWPGYVKSHSYLFEDGQVDGPLTKQAVNEFGIRTPTQMNCTILELLQWSVSEIKTSLL